MSDAFDEANKVVHKVEGQWHYKRMVTHGFKPETKTAVGFVRRYIYKKGEHTIACSTGARADHWRNEITGDSGYHYSLEKHLKTLEKTDD